jgi:hypothetical protein
MLKETLTYDDFDGVSTTEEMYFNLTKLELTEMAMDLPDGIAEGINAESSPADILAAITDKLGQKGIIEFIKRMVAKAYGIKKLGQDGKSRFFKSAQVTEDFESSMAFQAFVMELISNDDASARFFNGIIPSELVDQLPPEMQGAITTK